MADVCACTHPFPRLNVSVFCVMKWALVSKEAQLGMFQACGRDQRAMAEQSALPYADHISVTSQVSF